jgi:hypothetical protein
MRLICLNICNFSSDEDGSGNNEYEPAMEDPYAAYGQHEDNEYENMNNTKDVYDRGNDFDGK